MIFSDDIVKKCAYDSELKKIVYYISSLNREEFNVFKKKVNLYFMDKNTENDIQAYKFYNLLLTSNNAKLLKEEIERFLNGK